MPGSEHDSSDDLLVALARAKLSDRMKTKVDPEDIAQSAYRSFGRWHLAGSKQ